jgi:hypothetical protein
MSARKVFRAWDLIYSLLNSALSGEEYAQEMSYLTLQSGVYVGTEGAEQQADAWRAQYELRTVDRLVKSKVNTGTVLTHLPSNMHASIYTCVRHH